MRHDDPGAPSRPGPGAENAHGPLAALVREIEAVDWATVPGRAGWYEPERAVAGLRDLAAATGGLAAAKAFSLLEGGGILHGHSGAVLPAAAVAAPFLLGIAEHGGPAARRAAVGLLEESLAYDPFDGYTRIDTPQACGVPLCCAVAGHVRARIGAPAALGRDARDLLAMAGEHWRFTVRELAADGTDMIASGVLDGAFPTGRHPVELHDGRRIVPLDGAVLEYPPDDATGEAFLRLAGIPADRVRTGAALFPGACGRRVH
ncbi:hypothetical protein [Actinomadura sp. 21ATH]|uniref:hypothetical protein n=1 Tax=Actinomadura sp. 21ATH TaxID=1735444 RepID=UPI0035C21A28